MAKGWYVNFDKENPIVYYGTRGLKPKLEADETLEWVDHDDRNPKSVLCEEIQKLNDVEMIDRTSFYDPNTHSIRKKPARDIIIDTYKERRRAEYPPIAEQLEAIWEYLSDKQLSPQVQVLLDSIVATKARFPKE